MLDPSLALNESFAIVYPVLFPKRMEEDSSSWALVLGEDTEKNLRSYPWQRQIY